MHVDLHLMGRLNDFLDKKSIEDLVSHAVQQISILQSSYGLELLPADARLAKKIIDEFESVLLELGKKMNTLSDVVQRINASEELENAKIISTLSTWLTNIQRMRLDDTTKC